MTGYRFDMGPVATELCRRARESQSGMVATADYREMRAARKLVRRGLLVQFGELPFFFLKERAPW